MALSWSQSHSGRATGPVLIALLATASAQYLLWTRAAALGSATWASTAYVSNNSCHSTLQQTCTRTDWALHQAFVNEGVNATQSYLQGSPGGTNRDSIA